MAGASGRVSLRAGERRHSPFIRQRRQKAMPARIRGKSQLSIAREGFLDRRSKRCFWLLLSPQTKVARAGARNSPLRRGRGLYAAARRHLIRPLRGHLPLKGKANGGVSFNAADPSRGRLLGCGIQHREPIKGEGLRVRHSHRGPIKGEGLSLCGPGTRLPVTSSVGRLGGAAVGAKNAYRGWGKRPRQPPRR